LSGNKTHLHGVRSTETIQTLEQTKKIKELKQEVESLRSSIDKDVNKDAREED
jgi:hypothetical protein